MNRSRLVPWLALLAGLAFSAWALRATHPPYVWIALVGTGVAGVAFATTRGRARIVSFNVGAVILVLGLAELVAWRATPLAALRTDADPVFVTQDPILGNAGVHDLTTTVTRHDGDSLLFHVRYTLGPRGWRVTPFAGADSTAPVVEFFGCSLTFGEGVPDSATLPAQLSIASGGRLRTLNFGFPGYGPHQMLAILDHRLEDGAARGQVVLGVYQAIPSHIYRVLGRTSWDSGPRYRLDPAGHVRFAGHFVSASTSLLLNVLDRSFLVRKLVDGWNERLDDADYRLYFAVVEAARQEFLAHYPGARFVTLYWDTRTPTPELLALDRRLLAGLTAHGMPVYAMSRVLPGYPAEASRYLLGPHDAHPNELAYRILARFLLDHAAPGAEATLAAPPPAAK